MALHFLPVINNLKKEIRILTISIFFPAALSAQGTLQDYQRAEALNGEMQHSIYHAPENITWIKGQNKFYYSIYTGSGLRYVLVDPIAKTSQDYPEPAKEDIPGSNYDYGYEDRKTGKSIISPDKAWTAYIKNYNVYICPVGKPNEESQLSFDGSEGYYYSPFIVWSPDSKKLATNHVRANQPHMVYLIESSPADQLQPKLHSRNYLKPGDALSQKQPSLFVVATKKQVAVDVSLIPDQYEISSLEWRKDSRAFTFEYNKRGHQEYQVMEVDGLTGELNTLIKETSKTFINYSGRNYRYDVQDGREIIWASERDGWNHLYLYDGKGKLKNQMTKGNWVMRKVIHVDEKKRQLIFEASGYRADQDPYFIQYYCINFDGSGLKALTTENGNHKAVFSPGYEYFTDTYSRIDNPAVTVLRNAVDGKVMMKLDSADISPLLKTGWKMPEVFTAKGRDGKTDIWGMIIRPRNFDPAKKYPVIEYIYAGPQDSFVPKNFVTDSRGSLHELAELGFIVVQIDGMGTANRSKAFHDVCWKNLKDAGFPDRIKWIKSAAQKYSYMDTTRVGIFGNSAGGQNSAGALLFHPEFYKVAVSSSGCHDNRMDKIWWNEQWMGYPIGPQYAASSNVTNAHQLQGKLLLILGELDENVDPSSTIQLINALVKANKNFDFLEIPGMGHSLGGDYGEHKRRDFFVKHLLGVDPPEWNWKQQITVPKP
ncbi:DPP IV N-terminal domain-containing protein [Pedobacter sp. AW31-3R]|uniref:S9 family peptidase n=1 Tax=Pedobacter sp. AW31-3R TaxID=3445781 RepID=UPI003F9EE9C9